MKKIFDKENIDYFVNTYPPQKSKFPDGTDIEIYKYSSLAKLNKLPKRKRIKNM